RLHTGIIRSSRTCSCADGRPEMPHLELGALIKYEPGNSPFALTDHVESAFALAQISPQHKEMALGILVKKMKSEDSSDRMIRFDAASMVARLSEAHRGEAVAILREGLMKDAPTCHWAVMALRENGPEAKAAVPELIALWKDEEQERTIREDA